MNVATVLGARPQFVKAAPLSRAFAQTRGASEFLVHTGQHYDRTMSEVFFEDLGLPAPRYHLGVGSGSHGAQTGEMLRKVEEVLLVERPDLVLVYGDTNSTLAGALAAAKLQIPVAHVEAGLRSFDREMPEEINRVLVDHLSRWLFAPSDMAAANLRREGIENVLVVGDLMLDQLRWQVERTAPDVSRFLDDLDAKPGAYALATIHRAQNTDDPRRLSAILDGLRRVAASGMPVILPLHPRTREAVRAGNLPTDGLSLVPPLAYPQMVALTQNARVVLTDSGGLQKEAYWLEVPCVTLRDQTEWPETVAHGWNVLVGAEPDRIVRAARAAERGSSRPTAYGEAGAARRIADALIQGEPRSIP